jgi:sugar phosphate isomerase/epimerase
MSQTPTVIWVLGPAAARQKAAGLIESLRAQTACLTIGPPGEPAPDLDLGPAADLELALESCPPSLRPRACAWLAPEGQPRPAGLEALPCPVLGWGGAGPEGELPAAAPAAAQALLEAAGRELASGWSRRVQVSLPLVMLLERYQTLVEREGFNLEVGLDFRALDELGHDDLARARALLRGRRVTAHLPFGDLVPGSADPQVRGAAIKRLGQAATFALELGAEQAVLHLGYDQRMHPDPEEYARRAGQALWPTVARLAQGGCRVALETVFEPDPRPLLLARQELEDQGAPGVGFCLDVGHALTFSRTGLPQWWEALAPHILELHLHDNDGQGDWHLPPARGRWTGPGWVGHWPPCPACPACPSSPSSLTARAISGPPCAPWTVSGAGLAIAFDPSAAVGLDLRRNRARREGWPGERTPAWT